VEYKIYQATKGGIQGLGEQEAPLIAKPFVHFFECIQQKRKMLLNQRKVGS